MDMARRKIYLCAWLLVASTATQSLLGTGSLAIYTQRLLLERGTLEIKNRAVMINRTLRKEGSSFIGVK
jgi:hypothetical protein